MVMRKALTGLVTLLLAAVAVVLTAPTASAASLVQVTNFGDIVSMVDWRSRSTTPVVPRSTAGHSSSPCRTVR
jgi:hypothetical protein